MDIKINKDYRYVTSILWYIAFFVLASAISYFLPSDLQKNYSRFFTSHQESWFISLGALSFITIVFVVCRSWWKTISISTLCIFLFVLIGYEFNGNLMDHWLDVLTYIGIFGIVVLTIFIALFYVFVIIDCILKLPFPTLVLNDKGIYDYSHLGFIPWDNIQSVHVLDLGPQKQIAIEIINLCHLPLRPFSLKKLCFQAIFITIKRPFVYHITLNNSQVSSLVFSNIKTLLHLQNKLTDQHPGQGFIREFTLTKEELHFANTFELEKRLPVWQAIADLFLDVEVESLYNPIAHTLANSPYDLRTLNYIYVYEVAPVYHVNLLSVAGEWTGFSQENVKTNIVKYLYKKRRSPFAKVTSFLLRYVYTFTTKNDWKIITENVKKLRENSL